MNTTYHFQINPDQSRQQWEAIKAHSKPFTDRVTAIHFAQRLCRVFRAEVRLTEGTDPLKTSGFYFHHKQD